MSIIAIKILKMRGKLNKIKNIKILEFKKIFKGSATNKKYHTVDNEIKTALNISLFFIVKDKSIPIKASIKKILPPMELIVVPKEAAFNSATVVKTFGQIFVVATSFITVKPIGALKALTKLEKFVSIETKTADENNNVTTIIQVCFSLELIIKLIIPLFNSSLWTKA